MTEKKGATGCANPARAGDHTDLRSARVGFLLAALISASATPAGAAQPTAWPDTPAARLEALALIQTLNGEILASPSATLTLAHWCGDHGLAKVPRIIAHPVAGPSTAPTAGQRQQLQVSAQELVRYRRVELTCGEQLLSVADNWYVPSRLTAAMNHLLDTTLMPFGTVVHALMPHRETIEVKMLWSALPDSWASISPAVVTGSTLRAALVLPAALFEHRAILYTPQQQPIAEVDEVYQRGILAFPQPRLLDRAPSRPR